MSDDAMRGPTDAELLYTLAAILEHDGPNWQKYARIVRGIADRIAARDRAAAADRRIAEAARDRRIVQALLLEAKRLASKKQFELSRRNPNLDYVRNCDESIQAIDVLCGAINALGPKPDDAAETTTEGNDAK